MEPEDAVYSVEDAQRDILNIREAIDLLGSSRELSLAKTKLEEAYFWLEAFNNPPRL